jgi:hypothetical protein
VKQAGALRSVAPIETRSSAKKIGLNRQTRRTDVLFQAVSIYFDLRFFTKAYPCLFRLLFDPEEGVRLLKRR